MRWFYVIWQDGGIAQNPCKCECTYVKAFLHRPTFYIPLHTHTHIHSPRTQTQHIHTYAAHARREKWIAVETFHTHRKTKRKTHLSREIPRTFSALWALMAAGLSAEALLVREALVFHFILHIFGGVQIEFHPHEVHRPKFFDDVNRKAMRGIFSTLFAWSH